MLKKLFIIAAATVLFSGCASIPMANQTQAESAKQFRNPAQGKSGLYVYRDSIIGAALKKDIWVDGECLGESAAKVFFFREVDGDKDHEISTESEFSPNKITINTKSGTNYFVRQYIKMGAFVGGANLEVIEPVKGKEAIQSLRMAETGKCSARKTQ